jgi:HAMP domain-containing protein
MLTGLSREKGSLVPLKSISIDETMLRQLSEKNMDFCVSKTCFENNEPQINVLLNSPNKKRYIFTAIKINFISDIVKNSVNGSYTMIVDSKGMFVSGKGVRGKKIVKKDREVIRYMAQKKDTYKSFVPHKNINGQLVVGTYKELRALGLGVIVQQPVSQAFMIIDNNTVQGVSTSIILSLLGVFLAYAISRRLIYPLQELQIASKKIAGGVPFEKIKKAGSDEIGVLVDTFNLMSESLRLRNEQIKRQMNELSFLNAISKSINESLSLKELLKNTLLKLIDITDSDGGAVGLIDSRDPSYLKLECQVGLSEKTVSLVERMPMDHPLVKRVFEKNEPLMLDLEKDKISDESAQFAKIENASAFVGVPLRHQSKCLGILIIVTRDKKSIRHAGKDMFMTIGNQLGAGIKNARFYEEKKDVADTLQRSILPQSPPDFPFIDIATAYESSTAYAEVGGDYFDFIVMNDGRLALVLADVSGKGIQAATTTSMIKYIVRYLCMSNNDPAIIIDRLNQALLNELKGGVFVTMLFAIYDPATHELVYLNNGHPPPVICSNGKCFSLRWGGAPLGLFEEHKTETGKVSVTNDDTLVIFSDGVTEARQGTDLYGVDRLIEMLRTRAHLDAKTIAREIKDSCYNFSGGILRDDLAVIVFKPKAAA